MTLVEIIQRIEAVAAAQPAIHMIVRNDFTRINGSGTALYAAFGYIQGEHTTETQGNFDTYRFTLVYADRITEDHANEIQVQSAAIEVLRNIVDTLAAEGIISESMAFTVFTEERADYCAGAMCDVAFQVTRRTKCPTEFTEDINKVVKIIN